MIRSSKTSDIPGILDLLIQVDMVHHKGRPDLFRGPATKYNAEELEKIIKDPKTPVFVFDDGEGKILGHAFCIEKQVLGNPVLTDIKTLYIDDICVDENARGKGVGSSLYKYVKEYAKAHGFYNITLNVWSCNPGAFEFYEKMGLTPQKVGMEEIL